MSNTDTNHGSTKLDNFTDKRRTALKKYKIPRSAKILL